jgi:hypothetical protein
MNEHSFSQEVRAAPILKREYDFGRPKIFFRGQVCFAVNPNTKFPKQQSARLLLDHSHWVLFAIGTLAVGHLFINRLAVHKTRLGSVEIDELTVGRLKVKELAWKIRWRCRTDRQAKCCTATDLSRKYHGSADKAD